MRTRITFNELKRRAATINAAHNLGAGDIGAIQIYRDIYGYAVDRRINADGGVRRLFGGGETPKACAAYLDGLAE